jgi:hypothetical protein
LQFCNIIVANESHSQHWSTLSANANHSQLWASLYANENHSQYCKPPLHSELLCCPFRSFLGTILKSLKKGVDISLIK